MNPDTETPCLRCATPYPHSPRGRRSHFCPPCRITRVRERSAARRREARAAERAARNVIETYVERGIDREYAERTWGSVIEDEVNDLLDGDEPLVVDRMPAGANSPAGPDEGRSTNWRDLAGVLDQRAREAAAHPWWAANPHWSFELHDPDQASEYLNAA